MNAYGRHLLTGSQGVPPTPSMGQKLNQLEEDPPGPQPWRCFQIGADRSRFRQHSVESRIDCVFDWSHSFLTEKHGRMYPDVESDKRYFEALRNGEWDTWRNTNLAQAEDRGHHELLNWFCLAGAMADWKRKPDEAVFLEVLDHKFRQSICGISAAAPL